MKKNQTFDHLGGISIRPLGLREVKSEKNPVYYVSVRDSSPGTEYAEVKKSLNDWANFMRACHGIQKKTPVHFLVETQSEKFEFTSVDQVE